MSNVELAPDWPPSPPRLDPVTLQGRYVRLEPLASYYLPALTEAALANSHIWDYMTTRIDTAADAQQYFAQALALQANGLTLAFAVVDQATGLAVGSTRLLDYQPANRGVEIGHTWYAPHAQGTRVNPESKLLLLRHAFGPLRCMRVQLKTDERNQRSRAAILKLGATQEGTLRKHMIRQGRYVRNSVYFSITHAEWPAVESRLHARLA